jgi:hypothetical protein
MTGNARRLLALAAAMASFAAAPAHATLFARAIAVDAQDIKEDTGIAVLSAAATGGGALAGALALRRRKVAPWSNQS